MAEDPIFLKGLSLILTDLVCLGLSFALAHSSGSDNEGLIQSAAVFERSDVCNGDRDLSSARTIYCKVTTKLYS